MGNLMDRDQANLDELRCLRAMLKTDPQTAIEGLKALAERGVAVSTIFIVWAYTRGTVVPPDIAQAEEWNSRAMAAGYGQGSHEIGRY
jgi:TPR repeat protein